MSSILDDRALRALVQSRIFNGMNFAAQALRNLMYIRVALLFLLVVAGIVLSWLYTSDSLSEKETTSVRYAWMTWFGDTGLGLLVLRLATAISLSLVFKAMRDQTELMVQDPKTFFDVVQRVDADAVARSARRQVLDRMLGQVRTNFF